MLVLVVRLGTFTVYCGDEGFQQGSASRRSVRRLRVQQESRILFLKGPLGLVLPDVEWTSSGGRGMGMEAVRTSSANGAGGMGGLSQFARLKLVFSACFRLVTSGEL